jgi:hypothetical protein
MSYSPMSGNLTWPNSHFLFGHVRYPLNSVLYIRSPNGHEVRLGQQASSVIVDPRCAYHPIMTRYHTLTNTRYSMCSSRCVTVRSCPVHFRYVEAPDLMQATHNCIPLPLNEQHAAEPPFLEVTAQKDVNRRALPRGANHGPWLTRGRGKKLARIQ